MTVSFTVADTRDYTATLADGSVNVIVTSLPFLALRSYLPADHPDKGREIGSESNPAAFLDVLLDLTAGWRRVLAADGSLCVELGDTYSGAGTGPDSGREPYIYVDGTGNGTTTWRKSNPDRTRGQQKVGTGWPLPKSLSCIPDLYKIALAYGINPLTGQPSPAGRWRVRNDITWLRPNPPVGALGDKWRPASSRIIVACTSAKRWFDLDAVRGEGSPNTHAKLPKGVERRDNTFKTSPDGNRDTLGVIQDSGTAPPLDWHNDTDLGNGALILTTQPYSGSHYATFPMDLPRKLIACMCPRQVCRECGKARERVTGDVRYVTSYDGTDHPNAQPGKSWNDHSSSVNAHNDTPRGDSGRMVRQTETLGWTDCGHDNYRPGLVFDPFAGTGTTLAAAQDLGRDAIGCDLDERNADLARERVGMFLEVVT